MKAPQPPPAGYELKMEITEACDAACNFCYQGRARPPLPRLLPRDDVFRWIDWAEDNGIPAVRFTGGEPTLHPDLVALCGYARLRGRKVILNTNGFADPALYRRLLPFVDNVRVSLPLLDSARLDERTGVDGSLEKKMRTVALVLSAGRTVGLLTVLLPEVVGRLGEFVEIVRSHPGTAWIPLRFEPTPDLPRPWSSAQAQAIAGEVGSLMDRHPALVSGIRNATPFCAVEPLALGARVFNGRMTDCGPAGSLTVAAGGDLKSCYAGVDLGPAAPLGELRRGDAWRSCAGTRGLPEECRRCGHVARCGGGCRSPWATVPWRGKRIDYLAGFARKL